MSPEEIAVAAAATVSPLATLLLVALTLLEVLPMYRRLARRHVVST